MTSPSIFYSFLLATFLGSAFHFWKGGRGGRYLLILFFSWIGFYLGHLLGSFWDIQFLMIGPIYGGFGALGSLVSIFLGNWISQLDQS